MDEKRLSPEIEKRIIETSETYIVKEDWDYGDKREDRSAFSTCIQQAFEDGMREGFRLAIEMKCTACSQLE